VYQEALDSANIAIAIFPNFIDAYINRANINFKIKNMQAALDDCKKVLKLDSNSAVARNIIGNILLSQSDFSKAIEFYLEAIQIDTDYNDPYFNISLCYARDRKYIDSLKFLNKAIEIDNSHAPTYQNLSAIYSFMSKYDEVSLYSNKALNLSKKHEVNSVWESRLFHLIYHPDLTAREICDEHIRWAEQFKTLGQRDFASHDLTEGRRIRIGYVSPDFRGHTCRFYFEPLFANHDRSRFEIVAYSNVMYEDEHTQRFKTYFDKWRSILGVSDIDAAEMVRQDGIDILVDGCGHMMDSRLTMFAHRPAPVQVTWLGSAWTTGLQQMDYVLFDPYMAPSGAVASEKIIRLPKTWAAFRPGDRAQKTDIKESPCVKNGFVTFGYSGRTERLNYKVFKAWGQVLARLPNARLVLDYKAFADPKTQGYYKEFLQSQGIDISRVIMRNSENIFEGLGDVDILLDSFPHSGGTMLFDAVWMGVPVITMASDRPVGRIGTSLMTNLGLPDWVATSEQEYVDKAVTMANEEALLAALRTGMRQRMKQSPVMDEAGFAKDVENAFEYIWMAWKNTRIK
jgi:predicted O-linked N-acetylglucosamine transferase (SPINDLY family)